GGVGKTSACVNLAHLAAADGYVSLLWDLDPQGAASYYLGHKAKIKGGAQRMIHPEGHLGNFAQQTRFSSLDIIPADLSHRNLDLVLDDLKKSRKQFRRLVSELGSEYQYIFIDCPPVLGLLAEHLFDVADFILFPTIPTVLSERAYQQVFRYFKKNDLPTRKLFPFFSMVDARKRMHRDIQINFGFEYPRTLSTSIPFASVVEQMGRFQLPIAEFAPDTPATDAFRRLWGEVKGLG
ncbi:MAG: AAA family ATPase, partial [Bacteroidota bacterium]